MAIANIKATLNGDIKTVWEIVTSLNNYSWRSDISKIQVLQSGKKFIEYTKHGYKTTFTITNFSPMRCYEFDMENDNMFGHWVGLFSEVDDKTIIDFKEDITLKKWIMRPFVGIYLKRQQATYIKDLKKALEKR